MTRTPEKPDKSGSADPANHRIERPGGGQSSADKTAGTTPENRKSREDLRQRREKDLDEAIEDTFPASDPISPKQIT
jgi:hypothetical protein